MPFDLFYGVTVLMILLTSALWLGFYSPVRRIKKSLKRSREILLKEWKIQGNYTFFLSEGYKIFTNRILKTQWEMYIASCNMHEGHYEYADINEYFSPKSMLEETTNTVLASFVPTIILSVGTILIAAAAMYYKFMDQLTDQMLMEAVALLIAIVFLSICMAINYKQLTYKAKEQLMLFVKWISVNHKSIPNLSEQLSDIRKSMHSYQYEQLKFYAKLSEHITKSTKTAIKPYLDNTKKVIEKFVAAATERQVVSMQNLAEYFAKETTQLYLDQIQKISETTANMSKIQAQAAETLESVSTIYTESKDCILQVRDTTNDALTRYDAYLNNIEEMQTAVTATVKEMQDLVEYIRINSRNQNFTIENITRFQQELLNTSDKSTTAMQTFFTDFKDQYSSTIVALHAAASDMLKAGEILKGSYTGLAEDVNTEVMQVFKTFEENLATISVHLSRSTQDLQEAIDELPEILRQIKREDSES